LPKGRTGRGKGGEGGEESCPHKTPSRVFVGQSVLDGGESPRTKNSKKECGRKSFLLEKGEQGRAGLTVRPLTEEVSGEEGALRPLKKGHWGPWDERTDGGLHRICRFSGGGVEGEGGENQSSGGDTNGWNWGTPKKEDYTPTNRSRKMSSGRV